MALVQVTLAGIRTAPDAELARARAVFDRQHYLHLHQFFDRDLLGLCQRLLENAHFVLQEVAPSREDHMVDDNIYGRLEFLLNTPDLFTAVERMTGCGGILSWVGHVYRLEPGRGDFVDWHNDLFDARMLGHTINLSPEPYEGGILEIRERRQ